ncbi:hypothetical protein ERICI_02510 [Paenibacillus larvae subsp. larvae]|nr:hypothetical protein ERICI_02510 [Paenibacillus larvae subsp. larvae]AVF26678.1 hypothetical protein ERICIII_02532 [Paenibacillus larvae subsp. larvae]AVF31425.1 hypothetical protein ERICIV_02521 [Paenibacillus larvae subsp. larvae]ETK26810.1 hypothetical protein ERIC1_1c02420 [Paenibacillus larvae subsp. larvae DSM 25719]QHZ51710.1 hypothetical protein ERICV_02581 [Paenibacillus larvae subsp. larvae]
MQKELHKTSLGEAPMQIQATAQKYRKMPMGRTGIAGLRLFIMWLREGYLLFTLHSAKTQPGGTAAIFACEFYTPGLNQGFSGCSDFQSRFV